MEQIEGGNFLGIGTYMDGRGETYDSPSCPSGRGYMANMSFKIFGITVNEWSELVCLAGGN